MCQQQKFNGNSDGINCKMVVTKIKSTGSYDYDQLAVTINSFPGSRERINRSTGWIQLGAIFHVI